VICLNRCQHQEHNCYCCCVIFSDHLANFRGHLHNSLKQWLKVQLPVRHALCGPLSLERVCGFKQKPLSLLLLLRSPPPQVAMERSNFLPPSEGVHFLSISQQTLCSARLSQTLSSKPSASCTLLFVTVFVTPLTNQT
jgi:hypothetical protein